MTDQRKDNNLMSNITQRIYCKKSEVDGYVKSVRKVLNRPFRYKIKPLSKQKIMIEIHDDMCVPKQSKDFRTQEPKDFDVISEINLDRARRKSFDYLKGLSIKQMKRKMRK
jgi:hypothetical protein|tara:strand:+ start:194 stop:526 length:333 start_codon:yes stop_codon:yes gene_type:complete